MIWHISQLEVSAVTSCLNRSWLWRSADLIYPYLPRSYGHRQHCPLWSPQACHVHLADAKFAPSILAGCIIGSRSIRDLAFEYGKADRAVCFKAGTWAVGYHSRMPIDAATTKLAQICGWNSEVHSLQEAIAVLQRATACRIPTGRAVTFLETM